MEATQQLVIRQNRNEQTDSGMRRRDRNNSQNPEGKNFKNKTEKREKRERGKTADGRANKVKFQQYFAEQCGIQKEQLDKVLADWKTFKAELKKQTTAENQKPYRAKMAKLIMKPEDEITVQAGKALNVPVEIHNQTLCAWKDGIVITLDDSMNAENVPCETVNCPVNIEQIIVQETANKLKLKETIKMEIPVQIKKNANKGSYDMLLTLRNKKHKAFGEKIAFKLNINWIWNTDPKECVMQTTPLIKLPLADN